MVLLRIISEIDGKVFDSLYLMKNRAEENYSDNSWQLMRNGTIQKEKSIHWCHPNYMSFLNCIISYTDYQYIVSDVYIQYYKMSFALLFDE